MRAAWIAGVFLACGLALSGCMSGRYATDDRDKFSEEADETDAAAMVTPADVIRLSRAGVTDDIIITMIRQTDSVFELRAGDVAALADSGVSNAVIKVMLKTRDDEWEGDQPGYPRYRSSSFIWFGAWPYYSWHLSSPWYGGWYPGFRHYRSFHGPAFRFRSFGHGISSGRSGSGRSGGSFMGGSHGGPRLSGRRR